MSENAPSRWKQDPEQHRVLKAILGVLRLVLGFFLFRKESLSRLLTHPLALPVLLVCAVLAGLAHSWHLPDTTGILSGPLVLLTLSGGVSALLWYINREVAGYSVRYLPFLIALLATTPLHWLFVWPSVALPVSDSAQAHYGHWLVVVIALYHLLLVMFFLRVYVRLDLSRSLLSLGVPLILILSVGSCAESVALMDFKGQDRPDGIETREALARLSGLVGFVVAAAIFFVGVTLRRSASNIYRQHARELVSDTERSLDGENGVIEVCRRLSIWQRAHFGAGLADKLEEMLGLDDEPRALEACALFIWQSSEVKEYGEVAARVRSALGLGREKDAKLWASDYLSEHRPDLVSTV